ncbi:MAG TPA: TatD family hydrolase [Dehalococcoidia bacterium]|nr:TatD family hydrolase [Dehalococcoidia bacterium]
MLIDSHCHLHFPQFRDDRPQVLERAWQAGLSAVVMVGTDAEDSRQAVALAESDQRLFACVGCHPHGAAALDEPGRAALRGLASSPKAVAIGEIGLDFYRNLSPPDEQRAVFQEMLELAGELGLPVVIHARQADEETFAILSRWAGQVRQSQGPGLLGVLHCFSGDLTLALRYHELGFLISLAGTVTYPNAGHLAAVAAGLPLDAILVETDAPYLAPQAHRGRRNEPAYLEKTVARIAELRGHSPREVAERTAANAIALFRLPLATDDEPPSQEKPA